MRYVGVLVAGALLLVGSSAPQAFAQSNDEVFPQFQWNFATPGARANAMGRAFIGVANDASASITNPAGLFQLTRPQGYFEFKFTDLAVERLAAVESLFFLEPTEFSTTVTSPSFISVSVPIGDRLAVAFTRHEFLNYQEEFTLDPRPIPTTASAFFGVEGDSDFKGVSLAGSVAASVTPQFYVGATVSLDTLTATSSATRFGFDVLDPGNQFALASNPIIENKTIIDDSVTGISFIVGALILPTDKVTIGAQFAKGATFEILETLKANPFDFVNPPDIDAVGDAPGFPKTVTVNVPSRFGAGVAVRPTSNLLVAFDFLRVGYSSLGDDFTLVFDEEFLSPTDFSVDNIVEIHLGGEYLFRTTGQTTILLRGGMYTAPDHATRFTPSGSNAIANAAADSIYNLLPRDTDVVGTFGAGFVVGPKFQLDLAYVWGREFVASAGFRF